MDKYILEGSTGGYPYSLDEGEEPKIICDLCGNDCTDNFKLVDITASLSICVCPECYNQDPVEYESILGWIKQKRLNFFEEFKRTHPKEFAKLLKDKQNYDNSKLNDWKP